MFAGKAGHTGTEKLVLQSFRDVAHTAHHIAKDAANIAVAHGVEHALHPDKKGVDGDGVGRALRRP
ncbi:MAG: hypothetical protein SFW67_07975 [Myxococcaceae bacterium]|nr:hypothetical protein [Myxococcaceae bacterium]